MPVLIRTALLSAVISNALGFYAHTAVAITCPEPPKQFTQIVSGEARGEIKGLLSKIISGDLTGNITILPKDLFSKYPNADRLVMVLGVMSMYCQIINENTSWSDDRKLKAIGEMDDELMRLASSPDHHSALPSDLFDKLRPGEASLEYAESILGTPRSRRLGETDFEAGGYKIIVRSAITDSWRPKGTIGLVDMRLRDSIREPAGAATYVTLSGYRYGNDTEKPPGIATLHDAMKSNLSFCRPRLYGGLGDWWNYVSFICYSIHEVGATAWIFHPPRLASDLLEIKKYRESHLGPLVPNYEAFIRSNDKDIRSDLNTGEIIDEASRILVNIPLEGWANWANNFCDSQIERGGCRTDSRENYCPRVLPASSPCGIDASAGWPAVWWDGPDYDPSRDPRH